MTSTLEPLVDPAAPDVLLEPQRRWTDLLRISAVTGGASITPLAVLFFLNAADEFDRVAFTVLLPEIRDYFGVSLSTVVTVTTITGVFGLAVAAPIGYLSDRLPRNRLLAIGAVVWGLFSILTGFATSLVALSIFRFGSGAGKSLDPAQQSLLADSYPPHARAGVFSFHSLGNSVGSFLGPLLAGGLAAAFFWQAPFVAFGVVGFVIAVLAWTKLPEPPRGGQERVSLGLDAEAEENPPGWAEAWRITKSIRTLRRFWIGLPFVVGSFAGVIPLLTVYYSDVFHVSVAGRGAIQAGNEPFRVVGLIIGGLVGNRLLRARPGRVVTMAGLMTVVLGLMFFVLAVTPYLVIAIACGWVTAFGFGVVIPALGSLTTLVVPARVRGFALAVNAIVVIPGLLVPPIAAGLADRYGIRGGIALLGPVLIVGALVLASGGVTVAADIRAATAAAAANLASRDAATTGTSKLLVIRDLDVSYGPVQVLFNLDLDIEEGEMVALLGTNGAGKSTLLRAVAGLSPASNGAVFFEGEDVTYLPDSEHVERGIVLMPGGRGVFPTLTVAENLRLAGWTQRRDSTAFDAALAEVRSFFPVLAEKAAEPAGNLSGGEQQMLALGQAFLSKPKLLLIDELSLGLAPAVVEQLLDIVRAIHAGGATVVLVEQSVNVALTVAERAVFMERGEVRFSGPTAELMQRSDILRSVYLAGSASARGGVSLGGMRREQPATREPALELRGVHKSFGGAHVIRGVDLTLREGEILGLIGPNGAGKTTLFDLVSGFLVPDAGEIRLLDEDVTYATADARARRGLQRSFQDARLFPALTVEENLAVALDQRLDVKNPLLAALRMPNVAKAEARNRKRVDRLIQLIGLGDFRDKFLRELSTGTRRLVDLACVLGVEPQVLLLDEPSSGVAQRETEELGPLLQRVKVETGCSILIIEHDMPLISSVSDELVAFVLGQPVVRGPAAEVLDHPIVVQSYLGTAEDVIRRSGDAAQ
jgi:ABC-type branched-subunit amino acid transport system ATPase component/predicted MFS family arabinose efflux permease